MQNLNKFKELEDSDIYQVASWFEKQKSVYAINGQVFFFFLAGWKLQNLTNDFSRRTVKK